MAVINRGFRGRGKRDEKLPPGQYVTEGLSGAVGWPDASY